MTRLLPLLFLAACAPAPEPIMDADAPYLGKWPPAPVARPHSVSEWSVCPIKSPYYGKKVKPGHEDQLCYGDEKEPEKPEPPTEPECV